MRLLPEPTNFETPRDETKKEGDQEISQVHHGTPLPSLDKNGSIHQGATSNFLYLFFNSGLLLLFPLSFLDLQALDTGYYE